MKFSEPLDFGHVDRRRIYEYIESHGVVDYRTLKRIFEEEDDPRAFVHHIAILKRDGYIEEDEGKIRVALDIDETEEEFETERVDFKIRPARQEDLAGIVGAIRRVAEEKTYIVAENVAEEIDHQDALLRHNEVESRMFFVATVDNDVVGWVHINAPGLEKLKHTAELTVGVLDEYRGMGIGTHLLNRGLEWAASNGYEKVYNSVPSTNRDAIDFLEKNGWGIEAVRENHYKIDEEYVDEVMMAIEI